MLMMVACSLAGSCCVVWIDQPIRVRNRTGGAALARVPDALAVALLKAKRSFCFVFRWRIATPSSAPTLTQQHWSSKTRATWAVRLAPYHSRRYSCCICSAFVLYSGSDAEVDDAYWRHPKRLALEREEAVLERFTKILTQPDWGEGEVQVISNVSFPQRNTR